MAETLRVLTRTCLAAMALAAWTVLSALADPQPSESLGPAALGAEAKAVREALGTPAEDSEDLPRWRRTLWEVPNPAAPAEPADSQALPDGEPDPTDAVPVPATLAVEATLGMTIEDGKVASICASLALDEARTLALVAAFETEALPGDAVWTTRRGVGLGFTLDQLLQAHGTPTVVPGHMSEDGTVTIEPADAELDNIALDLRWRVSETEWLYAVVQDLDPRERARDLRVTLLRLERARS